MIKPDLKLLKHFSVTFSRSSGKGGQHVNTTDSKVQLKLTPQEWLKSRGSWLPEREFDNVMKNFEDKETPKEKRFPFFTNKMGILVQSSNSRVRDDNQWDCIERFCMKFNQCSEVQQEVDLKTQLHWDKLRRRDNERRIETKKKNKDKKQFRKRQAIEY